jgi:hypothetical protein
MAKLDLALRHYQFVASRMFEVGLLTNSLQGKDSRQVL